MKRTDDQRLQHFARRYDEIVDEPAIDHVWTWSVNLTEGSAAVSFREPSKQDVRSLLVDVRKLDTQSEDLYLPGVLTLLDHRVKDTESQQGIAHARKVHDDAQGPGDFHYVDDQGPMTLREAFRVWIYGEHLHDDFDKEERWRKAWIAQGFIRSNAVSYMFMLLGVATICRLVIERDSGLTAIRETVGPLRRIIQVPTPPDEPPDPAET